MCLDGSGDTKIVIKFPQKLKKNTRYICIERLNNTQWIEPVFKKGLVLQCIFEEGTESSGRGRLVAVVAQGGAFTTSSMPNKGLTTPGP